jgi:hypothetical protein
MASGKRLFALASALVFTVLIPGRATAQDQDFTVTYASTAKTYDDVRPDPGLLTIDAKGRATLLPEPGARRDSSDGVSYSTVLSEGDLARLRDLALAPDARDAHGLDFGPPEGNVRDAARTFSVDVLYQADADRGELGRASYTFTGKIDGRHGAAVADLASFLEGLKEKLEAERAERTRWVEAKVQVGGDGKVTLVQGSQVLDPTKGTSATVLDLLKGEAGKTVTVLGTVSGTDVSVAGLRAQNRLGAAIRLTVATPSEKDPRPPAVGSIAAGDDLLVTGADASSPGFYRASAGDRDGWVSRADVALAEAPAPRTPTRGFTGTLRDLDDDR